LHSVYASLIGEGDSGAVAGPEDAVKSMAKKAKEKEAAGAALSPDDKANQDLDKEITDTETSVGAEVQKGGKQYVDSLKQLQKDIQKSKTGAS
jgi:hypothetical protein